MSNDLTDDHFLVVAKKMKELLKSDRLELDLIYTHVKYVKGVKGVAGSVLANKRKYRKVSL